MHPESFQVRSGERGGRLLKGVAGALGPDFGEVSDRYGRAADVLAEEVVVVAEDAVANERDIVVLDQRPEPIEVSEHTRAPSCGHRQVQRGDFAVRFIAWMLEVGVTVEEGKAISAAAPQCQERSEHDAAVAAQQNREAVAVERGTHGVGSVARDRGNPLRVQDFRHRVAHRGIWRHCDAHRIG
jgi:hypothetical protein